MAEKKDSNKERLREITASIEQGIKELFESEKYKNYLSTMSRFPSYSLNNTILIHMQMPDATLVAGYNRWRDQFERHVKKGERGITIIAPTPYKRKVEEQKIDPDTKAPMLDKDGKIITEEKEIQIAMFKPVKVFDVSQTEGKPLPHLANDLTGDVQQFDAFMEALRRSSPVPIYFEKMEEGMDGYFSFVNQNIAIRSGMSEVQTVSAVIHEITHAKLHNPEKEEVTPLWKAVMVSDGGTKHDYSVGFETEADAEAFAEAANWRFIDENQFEWGLEIEEDIQTIEATVKDRNTEEVEAESVSYAVCQYYGIQTGENSFGYIAGWSKGKELAELKASLEIINKTAGGLIKDIDLHFKEVCKERGIDLSGSEQPEKDPIMELAVEIDQFFYDFDAHGYEDAVGSREEGVEEILQSIKEKDIRPVCEWLISVIEEEYEKYSPRAKELLDRLNMLVPEDAERKDTMEQVTELVKKLTDQIRDILHSQPSWAEAGFSINNGEKYLAIQTCADGYDYTFFDGEFKGLDGGQLDRPEIPIADAVRELLVEEGMEQVELSPFDFDDLVERGELSEQKHMAAAIAREMAKDVLKEYVLEDIIHITRVEVYQNLYGDITPLRYDALVEYEGDVDEDDFFDLLHEGRHNIAGYPVYFNAVNTKDTGPIEKYVARLKAVHGDKPVRIDPPEASEQKLDKYPVPDAGLCADVLQAAGYKDGDMLPISKERAKELYEKDFTIYTVVDSGNTEMLFDMEELKDQAERTLFAVSKDEWEQSPDFHERIMERLEHQEEREQAFLSYKEDCFAIYQLKGDDAQVPLRFMNLAWLESNSFSVERINYDLVYTGQLSPADSIEQQLETLYAEFNMHHPSDYHHPSMSVSDIVAVKQNGVISCHYCDMIGFQEIPGFLSQDNPLKNAELVMEDDYGMIDGIINNGPKEQPAVTELEAQARSGQLISLIDLADEDHGEDDKKKSVMEQLRSKPDQRQKKTAQKRSIGREI